MTRPTLAAAALASCLSWGLPAAGSDGVPGEPVTGLTGAAGLVRMYNAIFDARFDEIPKLAESACGPAPPEACRVLETIALWWQIQVDPDDPSRDEAFQQKVNAAIADTESWTQREPDRAEAWFYLGGAYGARLQWRVLRGSRLAAARDGKRVKDALDRALALDPSMADAYVGLGLYHYYADVARGMMRFLRWMLLLPGGDRGQGLREIERGRAGGVLLRDEADFQLQVIDLWYEHQPERALVLVEALAARHPGNPYFLESRAAIEDVYLHDPSSSLRSYAVLLQTALSGTLRLGTRGETVARLGMARQLDALFETDAAVDQLRAILAKEPSPPFGSRALAHVQLAEALNRLGQRSAAAREYQSAISSSPPGDPLHTAERAKRGLESRPDPEGARAYRLSIEGLRAQQRGDTASALRLLQESLALRPTDPVTRYRLAQSLQAQGEDGSALELLDALLVTRDGIPPTVYASACMDAARIHEDQGTVEQAAALYRTAISVFGIDRLMRERAERELARLSRSSSSAPR